MRASGPAGATAEHTAGATFEAGLGGPRTAGPARPANSNFTRDPDAGFAELDCVRARLAPAVIDAAEQRAARLGVGADRVLIAGGMLDEETYVQVLSAHLGIAVEPLDGVPRDQCPLPDARLSEAAAGGIVPLTADDGLVLVVAPRGVGARRLCALLRGDPALAGRLRLTTAERVTRFVLRHGGKALTTRATERLSEVDPSFSAGPPRMTGRHRAPITAGLLALAAVAATVATPLVAMRAYAVLLAMVFLSWLALRLSAAFIAAPAEPPADGPPDGALPVYTIIAALYREAGAVDGLLRALQRLDYPAEKLDIILALEADDHATRAAVAARKTRLPVTVVEVPVGGPRTKPKALNVALPFARGAVTVVYDAEDRPEPDQLRRALRVLRAGGDRLACVQARLCIDNTADSWLARLFTAEYAGQFDVFLPGLTALGLPLPLGGSSNHFDTAALRAAGGWDAFNVTEDADIGMRLARLGYRTGMIASTTYEEAPARLGPWLRQRTRWFKGWMQTWLVHMRAPRRLWRELGWAGFVGFQLCVGGNALAALVHPLFVAGLIVALTTDVPLWTDRTTSAVLLALLYAATAAAGYAVSGFTAWLGLKRRGLGKTAWALLLMPLHWLLLSLAAWRALYQLIVAPYAWEKTTHGLAKSSRLADELTHSLIDLERYLRQLKESGNLPVLAPEPHLRPARRRIRSSGRLRS